jgi:tyrosyl-tRNA synthetase
MATYTSSFMRTLNDRGYLYQVANGEELDTRAAQSSLVMYIGFDCTAPSLHVGSLIPIMMLRIAQKCGHKPIVLLGGGTTRVGDPSGKDKTRPLLTEEVIESNKISIRSIFEQFLTFGDGPTDALMVDNAEWLLDIAYIPFLRDIGRHFSLNRMLSFESVKQRLVREQEMSFLEFNYMLLQAYDFVELHRRTGCTVQMGGSDQWGNIINGVELGRRMGLPPFYAVTSPLLTTATGEKMGKTASGAVWLHKDHLSPYEYWQYWRNVDDRDVGRFLRLFTELELEEIRRLEALHGEDINDAKKVLASAVTSLTHGGDHAEEAACTAQATFVDHSLPATLPSVSISRSDLEKGIGVLTAFGPEYAKLVSSTSEARRQIKEGGLRINDVRVHDERARLGMEDLRNEGVIKLSFGKKKHVLLRVM